MKFVNEKWGCSFELPDKLTVRQQLAFWEKVNDEKDAAGSDAAQNWEAGKGLITNWQCEALPDIATSLDEMTSQVQALIVSWTGNQILMHIANLDGLPKNS